MYNNMFNIYMDLNYTINYKRVFQNKAVQTLTIRPSCNVATAKRSLMGPNRAIRLLSC